ncbi:hypothetical protein HID58_042453 [Brassica napus]|uniref:Uncharacterized protein n=1 Tax=Brassica napus TaxID=3708 RepID=A0ABQ8BFE6_BRANA|nr:hypothetical protein HID58_042453 [Brassica napus]
MGSDLCEFHGTMDKAGSPYRKFSFSQGKGAVPGTGPGELHSGEPGSVSCLGSGGIQYLSIFPQQSAPYCSILSSISGNNLCTQVNMSFSFSAEMGKLWASDGVLETVEHGALMFPEEERVQKQALMLASAFVMREGTAMMKPRSSLPRVAFSLWRVATFLGISPRSSFAQAQFFISGIIPLSLSLFSRLLSSSFSFSISRMKSKPDLALNSSSIGGRVRSKKQRSGAGPSESMDSSGSSLDLTAEVENPSRTVTSVALLSPETYRFLPGGPLLSIGVEEVASWRVKYHLPDAVALRVPGPIDRVSDFEADEVPVYEGFFESSFRDRVTSLVVKASEALEISPGQLNPPSSRILIALLNLGDLEGLTIGVTEVLYSYAITPMNGGERRYHLNPRGRELPVQEIVKKERKRLPVLMVAGLRSLPLCTSRVSPLFGAQLVGNKSREDIPSVDPSLGEKTIKQVLELPIECRQVPFLVSKEALERCSIWGSKGEEALAEYKRALEVMSAKKSAPKKAAFSENDDEVQFIKSNKRQPATALASSSKKKSRASRSTPKVSPSSSSDPATVLANLNTKVFPLTPVVLPEGDSSASIQFIHGDLLQAMSQLFHLGEGMGDHASLKADLAELTSQLREEKDNVLAKEKEIKALKLKVRNQDEAGSLAAAENISLREQLEQREEEVCDLRCAAETFDAEKTMAVSGVIVVARWEPTAGISKRYKMVKTSKAEYRGLPAPSSEGEPVIPSKAATEKTPEPTTDDPPSDP